MMPAESPHHGRTDNGTGHQIPVPRKFPHGLKPVADYISSLGMKMGQALCHNLSPQGRICSALKFTDTRFRRTTASDACLHLQDLHWIFQRDLRTWRG